MIDDGGETPVECPYDKSHIVSHRALSKHLMKCRLNHKGLKKVACRFDKTHLVPGPELYHHLSVCPSRYLLDRELQLKAAIGMNGILSGNLKGPAIVTNYMEDGEDWDSASGCEAPIALFNRKEMESDEGDDSNKPHVVPNYRNRPPRHSPSSSAEEEEEETIRKLPFTPSRAAKISEISKRITQPISGSQVYTFSLAQASGAGWGRGRRLEGTAAADSSNLMQVSQPSGVAVERYSNESLQVNNTSPVSAQHSHKVRKVDHLPPSGDSVAEEIPQDSATEVLKLKQRHQQQLFYKQWKAEQEHSKTDEGMNTAIPQGVNVQKYENQPQMLVLPKGRGYYNGKERLRQPASSSYAQVIADAKKKTSVEKSRDGAEDNSSSSGASGSLGSKSSSLSSMTNKTKASSSSKQSHQDDEDSSSDVDMALIHTGLRKQKQKLDKKLKQIQILEQKLSLGENLNEAEVSKIQKKEEILMMIDSILKILDG